ncbi:MAG: hypothetical protein U1E63_02100 [Burkholderiales bacterium]
MSASTRSTGGLVDTTLQRGRQTHAEANADDRGTRPQCVTLHFDEDPAEFPFGQNDVVRPLEHHYPPASEFACSARTIATPTARLIPERAATLLDRYNTENVEWRPAQIPSRGRAGRARRFAIPPRRLSITDTRAVEQHGVRRRAASTLTVSTGRVARGLSYAVNVEPVPHRW